MPIVKRNNLPPARPLKGVYYAPTVHVQTRWHVQWYSTGDGRQFVAKADYDENTVAIMAYGFNEIYSLDEYTEFEGDMQDFGRAKIADRNKTLRS